MLLVSSDERQLDTGSDETDPHSLTAMVHLDDVAAQVGDQPQQLEKARW